MPDIEKCLLDVISVYNEVDSIIKSIDHSQMILAQYCDCDDGNTTVGDKFDEYLLDVVQSDTRNRK